MMKRFLTMVLAGMAVATVGGAAFAADDAGAQIIRDAKAFDAAVAKNDCKAGLPLVRRLVAFPRFPAIADDARLSIWSFGAACAWSTDGLQEEAFEDARQATAIAKAEDWVWQERIELGAYLHRPDDVADAVEAIAETRPRVVDGVPIETFSELLRAEREAGRPRYVARVLAALEKADYKPSAPTERADTLWLAAALMAADAGDQAHAAALLRRIDAPFQLLPARLDGRFAAIVQADPKRFDIAAAAERELAADRAEMAAHGDLLAAVQSVSRDLRSLQRYDEALALVQAALDRVAKAPKGKPAFKDEADQLNWIYDEKANALIRLGHLDEGLATERQGASVGEDGASLNVSQTINLAGMYDLAGRPQEALTMLQDMGGLNHASPYGVAWVHAERACAYQALGQSAQMSAEIDYLNAHRADNPGALLKSRLCAADLDGAAALVIARLQDTNDRGQMLVNLCQFADASLHTPFDERMQQRLNELRRRADIQAAIAKVGRIETVPLSGDTFIDLY